MKFLKWLRGLFPKYKCRFCCDTGVMRPINCDPIWIDCDCEAARKNWARAKKGQ